jgi:hypothetical protein
MTSLLELSTTSVTISMAKSRPRARAGFPKRCEAHQMLVELQQVSNLGLGDRKAKPSSFIQLHIGADYIFWVA